MEVIVNKQIELDAIENRAVVAEKDCHERSLCMDKHGQKLLH